jgi:diacylglycerol kinase
MNEYKKLFRSFIYAFQGIGYVIKHERNFRIHLSCIIYMFSILLFSDWFTLTRTDYAVLLITSALVLSLEIVNTAVENAVNLYGEEHTKFGKIAKDAGAGAVLIAAIFAVLTGIAILLQPDAFMNMYVYFKDNPLMFVVFVLSIIPMTLFIFWGNPFSKRK